MTTTAPEIYGRALDAALRREGMRARELAEAIGVQAPTVSRWRRGHALPRLSTQREIYDRLAVHPYCPRCHAPVDTAAEQEPRARYRDDLRAWAMAHPKRVRMLMASCQVTRQAVYQWMHGLSPSPAHRQTIAIMSRGAVVDRCVECGVPRSAKEAG